MALAHFHQPRCLGRDHLSCVHSVQHLYPLLLFGRQRQSFHAPINSFRPGVQAIFTSRPRLEIATRAASLAENHQNRWFYYGFDLDEDRDNLDVAAVRTAIERHPAVVLVGISAGGDALYAWVAGPVATSATEYKDLWGEIAKRLPGDAALRNDARAHNFNRVRMLASDPTLYLATEATPFKARDLVEAEQGALL